MIFIIHCRCKVLEVQVRRTEGLRPENDFDRFYLILLFNSLYRTFVIKITSSCLDFFLEMIQNGLVYATPKESDVDKTENVC